MMYMYTKNCEFCGNEFETNRKTQIYCKKPHPAKCFICNEDIEIQKPKRGRKNYPCKKQECKSEAVRRTNLQRYGVENVAQVESTKEKAKKTNLKRYGTEHPFKSEEVKKKIKKTNLERYGTENPRWHNEESKKKAEKTNLKKYGHINPFGSEMIKEKIVKHNLEKYGVEWATQAKEVKEKMKQSYVERYGVDNPAKAEEIKRKIQETVLKKYGSKNFIQTPEFSRKYSEEMFKKYGVYNYSHIGISNYKDYINLYEFLSKTNMSISEIAEHFNLPRRTIRRKIIEVGLQGLFDDLYVNSVKEDDFYNFLKSDETLKNINVERNNRKILNGKELDFYFPDHNLAVEISPTYTHNSKTGWGGKTEGVPKNYHKEKFMKCQEKGVELITIFDWHDWKKILQIIKIKLNGSETKKYARKLKYEENQEITKELFNNLSEWHILSLPSNIKKKTTVSTLTDDGEVIAIALWGNIKEGSVELKRLTFKPGVNVPGGASKLIKNFLKERPEVKEVFTFSDCDLGGGQVYEKIGFKLIEESKPSLSYFNPKYDFHIKHLSLIKQGADRLLRNFPGYTPVGMGENSPKNTEIIESYGFLPVYDCGYRKWKMLIQ